MAEKPKKPEPIIVFGVFIVIVIGPARCQLKESKAYCKKRSTELLHSFVAWCTGEKRASCRSDNQFEGGYDSFQVRIT